MGLGLYYDPDGNPIDRDTWYERVLNQDDTRVALDRNGSTIVSTVWLGIDLGGAFRHDGPPLIYETMVFSDDEFDGRCERTPTRDAAKLAHLLMCKTVGVEITEGVS